MREFPSCEAEIHTAGCNGKGETRDHFQPKVIGKLWRTSVWRTDSNYQYLSEACHREKDRDTALRSETLRFQLNGGSLNFDQHREIFKDR